MPEYVHPRFGQVDLQVSRRLHFSGQSNPKLIAAVFNLFNRFNAADVNPLRNPPDPATCRCGETTPSLDQSQFQFAPKLNW